MATLGYWATVLTFVVSLYVGTTSIRRARRAGTLAKSARAGALVAATAATVASVSLVYLLLTHDYSVGYVYRHASRYLPSLYVISAMWAGQEGSLLLWLWFVTLMTATMATRKRVGDTPFGPYALAVMASVQAFLALILLLASNPFETLSAVPPEGRGLNPLLQNFWMIVHPPVVFAGYAAYAVPFALVIGGLTTRQMEGTWLRMVRRWALLAWLLLGAGILMGAYWAYLELGWGGYWGWDPVENSSLMPWLTGTALLHSLMMQQRRRGFQAWNLWLIALTFILCLFATFVTRSGIIQSVHAFGRSPIGAYFAAFIVLCLVAFVALLHRRRPTSTDQHESEVLLSREVGLLLTNLLLAGAALVVLLGTLFPALSEAIQGRQAALDPSFYERTVGPLAQLVILLMGLCPWLAWGGGSLAKLRRALAPSLLTALATAVLLLALGIHKTVSLIALPLCAFVLVSILTLLYRYLAVRLYRGTDTFWPALSHTVRTGRRRYGAHLVHLGIVLIAVGVTGSSVYQDELQGTLAPGETIKVGGYTLKYAGYESKELPDQQRFKAIVEASRGGRSVATLEPRQDYHWNIEQWVTEVAVHTNLRHDLYLILAGLEQDGLASFRVLINPLVAWLWIGGALVLFGGTTAWWPSPGKG